MPVRPRLKRLSSLTHLHPVVANTCNDVGNEPMLNHDSRPVGLEAIVGADVLIDEHLWIEAGYCHELAEYGDLDEEAYVVRQMGQPEQGIRAWLVERLNRLAGA